MAYVVETLNTTTTTEKQIGLGVKLSNNVTCFDTLYDMNEQAKENLKSLLLTKLGERYMLPDFGTQLLNIIFEPNNDLLSIDIQSMLAQSIGYWLPYINLQLIDVKTAQSNHELTNEVEISITYNVLDSFNTDSIKLTINQLGTLTVQ